MKKEPYVKPLVASEELKPEALINSGSPAGGNNGPIGGGCPKGNSCP